MKQSLYFHGKMKKYKAKEHVETSLSQEFYWIFKLENDAKTPCSIHYYLQPWFPVRNKKAWFTNQKFWDFPIGNWKIT